MPFETKKNPQKLFKELSKLDYRIIQNKLKEKYSPTSKIKRMKKEGLRFISLCATQNKPMAPAFLVDEFWHQTILDTKKYEEICRICGKFIHHNPSDGKKNTQKMLRNSFWDTIQAYEDNFGEPDLEIWGLERIKQRIKG